MMMIHNNHNHHNHRDYYNGSSIFGGSASSSVNHATLLWMATLFVGAFCGSTLTYFQLKATIVAQQQQQQQSKQQKQQQTIPYILAIPQGKVEALPSIRIPINTNTSTPAVQVQHGYGGAGDKPHLGGFVALDTSGISPALGKDMVTWFGIRSIMDVGCGRGISTSWFITHGVDALCIEGSHDAIVHTMLPHPATQIVEHDYSRGPWWPADKTYDAVWTVEFLEHVGRNYHFNYVSTFRKAALIFATHSWRGGWHHVEVHDHPWWIAKYESYGLRYSDELTKRVKEAANRETGKAPNGDDYNGNYIKGTMKVFINPAVAALPEHAHLLAEPGCYQEATDPTNPATTHRECDTAKFESLLPDHFKPLPLTPEMDQAWDDILKTHLTMK